MVLLVLLLAAGDFTGRVDRLARETIDAGTTAGLAVAVVERGRTLVAKGYGYANVELRADAGPETVFRIGSITKQFTAAAILQLVERGKLRLDEEVALPGFPLRGHHPTIAHLLGHTSGIPEYVDRGEAFSRAIRLGASPADVLALFKDAPFDFEPGARWEYSNSNYHLLGLLLERASGMRYAEYLATNVFPRAGLTSTRYCDDAALIPGRAAGYAAGETGLRNATAIAMSVPFAAGGLCSTAIDLARWAKALEQGQVVSRESYARMVSPSRTQDGKINDYGYGLYVGRYAGHPVVWHGGFIAGFSAELERYPDDDLTVVVLRNTEGVLAVALAERIARAALALPQLTGQRVPADLGRRCAGEYVIEKTRLSLQSAGDKLFAKTGKEDAVELLRDGDALFSPTTLRRYRCNGGTLSVGDGKRWAADLPRAP